MSLQERALEQNQSAVESNREATTAPVFSPEVDILETTEGYELAVYLPGVSEKNVEATVENHVLTIRGRTEAAIDSQWRLARQEFGIGHYRRVLSLSDDIDQDRVTATVRDGVLHLALPKLEQSKAKRIPIQAA